MDDRKQKGMLPSQDPEINEGKFFAVVGYVSILCFVPLLLKKENKFALFHGKQGLVLFVLEVAAGILRGVPAVGDVVFALASVICGILSLVGILKALMNEYWEMPLVYEVSQKISL
ncbi:MAG TPA: hypothetical protein PKL97_06725 [Candidatus Omnitrophota bacterium]|nr:hypothetical protein [Candidatus Omnitrophota bacterium]